MVDLTQPENADNVPNELSQPPRFESARRTTQVKLNWFQHLIYFTFFTWHWLRYNLLDEEVQKKYSEYLTISQSQPERATSLETKYDIGVISETQPVKGPEGKEIKNSYVFLNGLLML